MNEGRHEEVMLELSVAHDEGRQPDSTIIGHLAACTDCRSFAVSVGELDVALGRDRFELAPNLSQDVLNRTRRNPARWVAAAAVIVVGVTVGALVGLLGSRADLGLASELPSLYDTTGRAIAGLSGDIVIAERGVHPSVAERVYTGSLSYRAPERLNLELLDTTRYPDDRWIPNHVRIVIDDDRMLLDAGVGCPVAAMPDCLVASALWSSSGQPPFTEEKLGILQLVGPGRSFSWPSGLEILGSTTLDDRPVTQVRTTVATVELLDAITQNGSWRQLHPTDEVVMWLDEETLVPLRIEVTAANTEERELWQIRRGYDDLDSDQPIFILELSNLVFGDSAFETDIGTSPVDGGFVADEFADFNPELPDGFVAHRSGVRFTHDGREVRVGSWSDGRSWVKIEVTDEWEGPNLFGMSSSFLERLDTDGDIMYLNPENNMLAIHTNAIDVVISGSLPRSELIAIGQSLPLEGRDAPASWEAAQNTDPRDLPAGTLVPDVDGWSILARVEGTDTAILLTSGGSRSVLIKQEQGSSMDLPIGPDVSTVSVRGVEGRYDAGSGTLQWLENGFRIEAQGDLVTRSVLLELVESMS